MDPASGIILNDEMDDFSTPGTINAFGLPASPYNYPEPNKRPLSSTSAMIMESDNAKNDDGDKEWIAAIGGSGGSRIFPSVAQVLLNLEWGMDVVTAVEEPRLHDQLFPAYVGAETGGYQSLGFVRWTPR